MTPERWDRIKQVFQSVLERDADERELFVDEACGSDADLRREVMRLLHEHRETMTTNISRDLSGQTISHYKVIEKLGEGGMGVVYKAEDTKLHRTVALKFIRPDAVGGEELKNRFLKEARAAAALDHPNVCTVHDIDEVDTHTFLAMAYVEGTNLSDKIRMRPLQLEEALDIAAQMAAGLQAAHDNGIVHRDIKGANVMVTGKGRVKIMDFGLADLAGGTRLTKTGTIMGTPAYMSPEQVRGEEVDHRTDIWSLGVVLYEMMTGRLPFRGESSQSVALAIQNEEPEPVTALRAGLPMELEFIVGKALAKDAAERHQRVEELGVDLRSLSRKVSSGSSRTSQVTGASAQTRNLRLPWAVAAITTVALLVLMFVHFRQQPLEAPQPALRRFSLTPPIDIRLDYWSRNLTISPDGGHIVMASREGERKLWLQDLDRWQPRSLAGTEGAMGPFWSPDGEYIAFATDHELKKVRVEGGAPIRVCQLPKPRFFGGTWSPDGESIVFASDELYEVPANGGAAELVRLPDEFVERRSSPWFLPRQDGARVLLFAVGSANHKMYLYDLETSQLKLVGPGRRPSYSASGHIVYEPSDLSLELWAQPFSLETLQVTGEAFLITEDSFDASVAADGTLVFHHRKDPQTADIVWLDRRGEKVETIGRDRIAGGWFQLSPDGAFAAYMVASGGDTDIWLYDLARRRKIRFTTHPGMDNLPKWSPSGEYIAFSSDRAGSRHIFLRQADGSGEAKALTDTGMNWLNDWSRDGKYLLYEQTGADRAGDIWYLEQSADGSKWQPKPFLATQHGERFAALSPNGRFVAYLSRETGPEELYVRPFPVGNGKWAVSSGGAGPPRWRSDGRELFYASQGALMAVPVSTEPSFSMGTPARLFDLSGGYDVSADGQRFLVAERVENTPQRWIRVAPNWFAEFEDEH